jgi:hypothetical protein
MIYSSLVKGLGVIVISGRVLEWTLVFESTRL